ncbi:MAG: helix-turn-helix domain-containing protein [Bacteroidota bacterium]
MYYDKNLTQEDIGFIIGNSGKQIGRIERGENNVSSCMLYQISKALEVELKELVDFKIPIKKRKKIEIVTFSSLLRLPL